MKIAIKNPAPLGPNLTKWGDYHFALSLRKALEARGATVVQHFWPEWDKDEDEDAIIVLRGKRRWQPPTKKVSLLWVISHPATVSVDEIDSYSVAYVASATHRKLLEGATRTPVEMLRQCADTTLFTLPEGNLDEDIDRRRDIIFVANSRGIRRDIVQWAVEAGVRPSIVGRHWGGIGLSKLVKREYIDNVDLPDFYRSSRLSLNDHWGDMLYFGTINNRIFDCLAAGLPVLTDDFPELREVCGDSLLYASDAVSYWDAIRRYTLRYPEVMANARRLWEGLKNDYSFDARAERMLIDAKDPPKKGARLRTKKAAAKVSGPTPLEVLETKLSELVADQKTKAKKVSELQLFHVCPTQPGTEMLAGRDDFNYLSASVGVGPWHIALQLDASQIPEDRFDLLVLENPSLLASLSKPDRQRFLRALFRRAKVTAAILVDETEGADLPDGVELTRVGQYGGWGLYKR